MNSAFDILGLDVRLALTEEKLIAAFRAASKLAHPDVGGCEGDFAKLREAYELLASPSRRLKHWLEWKGAPSELRGTVSTSLMDLFSNISEVTQRAEALIRKRNEAKSSLVIAMLERETQSCREEVESCIRLLRETIHQECSTFPSLDHADQIDAEAVSLTARNLAFLEKWQAGLRGVFSRLA
ncbi:MAG: hypothetical protein H8M99_12655 [Gloeobacteraceae cyanobacterium ES-bin-144]|nr:hypothetical protein [Verrucomicrobiales bacterium]